MAGGIDWFRWHHGSVTDQKFPLIARKAGASVAEVIAVWACLLEAASMNAELRGHIGGEPDFEAIDCALGMDDGRARAIYLAMTCRGLVDDCGHISAWPTRQPKREREDTTNADRQATFKAKKNQVTPDNTSDNQKTPREEKSREEKKEEQKTTPAPSAWVPSSELVADGLPESLASEWLAHRKARKAKLTPLAWAGFKSEVSKAGWSVEDAVRKAIARNWTAFEADWVAKAQSPPRQSYTDQQRAQLAALTGARTHQGDVIDV